MATIAVKNRSVATSGNSQRGWRIAGRWYSHIFDPRTGLPVESTVAASVIAEDAAPFRFATVFVAPGPQALCEEMQTMFVGEADGAVRLQRRPCRHQGRVRRLGLGSTDVACRFRRSVGQ